MAKDRRATALLEATGPVECVSAGKENKATGLDGIPNVALKTQRGSSYVPRRPAETSERRPHSGQLREAETSVTAKTREPPTQPHHDWHDGQAARESEPEPPFLVHGRR